MTRTLLSGPMPLAALALFGSLFLRGIGRCDDAPDKTKQIAELEKQIAELQSKFDALKASPGKPAGKKPLSFADAETWRALHGAVLSGDGKWFACRSAAANGDGEVILRSVTDGKETKFSAGGGSNAPEFSFDSKWLAFTAAPPAPKGPNPGPRGRPKVVLVNLGTGEKSESEGMQSFTFSGEAATHVALRKAPETPAAPPAGASPPAPPAFTGTDLVLRELAGGSELLLGNVAEFGFDRKGQWLVLVIDAAGQTGNGVQLRDMKTGAITPLDTGKASYRGLTWSRDTTAIALLKGTESKPGAEKTNIVLAFTDLGPNPTKIAYDPKVDKAFPADLAISTDRPALWSDDLGTLTFGIAAPKPKEAAPAPKELPKKEEPKNDGPAPTGRKPPGAVADAKPDLVIWHWKDDRLQPMQEKQASADKSFTYLAAYRVADKKFVRLAEEGCRQVTLGGNAKFALGQDAKPYQLMGSLDGKRFTDVYAIEPATGKRTQVLTKARHFFGTDPAGTRVLHHDGGHFHVVDLATGQGVNITERIVATAFVDLDDDHNVTKPPTRTLGWSRDGQSVLISDGYDLWKVAADGSGGENLTLNGKKEGLRYTTFHQFEPEPREPGFDFTKTAYVGMYGEWTKKSGYAKWEPGKPGIAPLIWADAAVTGLQKARAAEVYSYTRGTATEYPDVYLAGASLADGKRITAANPQQADFAWGAGAKLIEYKGTGDRRLQGALYLPADYEPGKKYPTVVYIYEKLSQEFHRHTPPGTGALNKAIYTSNGYAVFTPDIAYRLNDPGVSAVECVLPGLDAAIATGIVDPARVGLHGHSWGGYQTAFLVTQTDRFKAAVAGAPLTDLVSMYSSVYWNSGGANQPIFESSQGRFTGGYWTQQEAYIRNSPVYQATKVNTPLVILHNDKDGAVDFGQGLEYYNTLRRLQKPVVMLQYKGENHGLAKPENLKDYSARVREFFDHHLKAKPAPDWWTEGVPHLKIEAHLKNRKP